MAISKDDKIILSSFIVAFCAFTSIYITQPLLPIIERDLDVSSFQSSLSMSLVLAGITLGCIPSGALDERISLTSTGLTAAILLIVLHLACANTSNISLLISMRFCQGLCIPFLTSAVASSLSRSVSKANISRGIAWYVTATILGGMSGRLLGGLTTIFYHWKFSFILSALLVFLSCFFIPKLSPSIRKPSKALKQTSYSAVIRNKNIWPSYFCAFLGQGIFSAVFNTIPFRLDSYPFNLSADLISLLYMVYIVGLFTGPFTSKVKTKAGYQKTLFLGAIILAVGLLFLLGRELYLVIIGLSSVCVGFFIVHINAAARLNSIIKTGLGEANSLYMIWYYLGGFTGSLLAISVLENKGWNTLICLTLALLCVLTTSARENLPATCQR